MRKSVFVASVTLSHSMCNNFCMHSLTSCQNLPQSILFSVTVFFSHIKKISEATKPNNKITACHHKMQLVQFRFGTSVVKGLEDGPCDGAWHVKNAPAQAHAQPCEEILLATAKLWGCPRRERPWVRAKLILTYHSQRPAVCWVFADNRAFIQPLVSPSYTTERSVCCIRGSGKKYLKVFSISPPTFICFTAQLWFVFKCTVVI